MFLDARYLCFRGGLGEMQRCLHELLYDGEQPGKDNFLSDGRGAVVRIGELFEWSEICATNILGGCSLVRRVEIRDRHTCGQVERRKASVAEVRYKVVLQTL